jgi:hypothetical protein
MSYMCKAAASQPGHIVQNRKRGTDAKLQILDLLQSRVLEAAPKGLAWSIETMVTGCAWLSILS